MVAHPHPSLPLEGGGKGGGERKVRAPQGRVLRNAESVFSNPSVSPLSKGGIKGGLRWQKESATEKIPPRTVMVRGKGEKAR